MDCNRGMILLLGFLNVAFSTAVSAARIQVAFSCNSCEFVLIETSLLRPSSNGQVRRRFHAMGVCRGFWNRSAKVGDEIGGHNVSGHVCCTAPITDLQESPNNRRLQFQVGPCLVCQAHFPASQGHHLFGPPPSLLGQELRGTSRLKSAARC